MDTRLLDFAAGGERAVREAAAILKRGGLVAFPTETVYGLGALGLDPAALERIFEAKNRPHSDPLILHVPHVEAVRSLTRDFPPAAERLAGAFWPGPLTLVLPRSELVPELVTAGLGSVAVRMPAHPVALSLLREVGAPLAAPSANLFSRPSPTTAEHVLQDLAGRIDAVLDAGPTRVGVESTVLDLRGDPPVILRPGGVSRGELERVLDRPVAARGVTPVEGGAPSPGLLAKHYSPRAEVRLFEGEEGAVLRAMRREIETGSAAAPAAVLAFNEELPALAGLPVRVVDLGSRSAPEVAARSLYAALRELDQSGIRTILAHTVPPGGIGDAINDRLRRAASGRVRSV